VTLEEKGDNLYGALCYALGWLSAIYFLNVKRRSIRWHARQSIIVFGGLMLGILVADSMFPAHTIHPFTYLLRIVSMSVLIFSSLGLWVLLPLQTFRGKPFLVPFFAPLTLKIAGEPPWTLPTEPWEQVGMGAASGGPGPSQAWGDTSGSSSPMPCPSCGGSGRMICPSCGGKASWYDPPTTATGTAELRGCSYCNRSGSILCTSCSGSGRGQALI
jgi:uncharacterized membrane protein